LIFVSFAGGDAGDGADALNFCQLLDHYFFFFLWRVKYHYFCYDKKNVMIDAR